MIEINEQILTGIMVTGFIFTIALLITIIVLVIKNNKNQSVQKKSDQTPTLNNEVRMRSQCYKKNNNQPYNWSIDPNVNSETECINKNLNCPIKWVSGAVRECEKNNTCTDNSQKCYIWDIQETVSSLQK